MKLALPGACAVVTGSVQATGQAATAQEPRIAQGATPADTLTLKSDLGVDAVIPTQFGALKTSFEVDWSYVNPTGFDQVPNLDAMNASFSSREPVPTSRENASGAAMKNPRLAGGDSLVWLCAADEDQRE